MVAQMASEQRRLCFEREELSNAEVPITDFVSAVRTKAPLSTLREDLRVHLEELSNELIAQIQANFTDFISLGRAVADVDHLADASSGPLQDLQSDVGKVLESFDSDIDQLAKTLDKRRELASRRTVLELFLRISDLVHKCERLLKEVEGLDNYTDERCRTLERIASESAQVEFCLGRADNESKFVQALQPRLEKLKVDVRQKLEAWLKRVLREDQTMLIRALAAFAAAGMSTDAENLFRTEIVSPFVSARLRMTTCLQAAEARNAASGPPELTRVAAEAKSRSSEGDGGSVAVTGGRLSVTPADALESAEIFISDFVREKCEPITTLCDAEERLRSFDFINNAVWPEDVFHRAFRVASRIFAIMANACKTSERQKQLHSHAATQDFWRRWSLPIYFQLRFQEITVNFETALGHLPKLPKGGEAGGGDRNGVENTQMYSLLSPTAYHLEATRSLVKCVRQCWDDDVFLKPLTHRFLRLSLQLLSRYARWVEQGVGGAWETSDGGVKELALVYADMEVLRERLGAELASLVRMGAAAELDESDLSSMDRAFSEGVEDLVSVLPTVAVKISALISKGCTDSLQPLRGILATYRMTNRPAPTQHSRFVPNVLKPLRQFLADPTLKVSESARMVIILQVVEATVTRYFEMATDLLHNERRAAATLKRLNIGRQDGTSRPMGSNAEMDKITMQLYLDVRKFGADIVSLGISTDDVPAYQRLKECVEVDAQSESSKKNQASALSSSAAHAGADTEIRTESREVAATDSSSSGYS